MIQNETKPQSRRQYGQADLLLRQFSQALFKQDTPRPYHSVLNNATACGFEQKGLPHRRG
ncbi:hypothetical protein D0T90_09280 [Neisseria animalis]|uniref:Uncharacterized protein n=1 Tax=Neisseria animalis TaxID=492 RepID=A0A5P3MV29_NEIAN|nr:hypothetical protein D0T90_09280 [Neisseria animalis]